MIEDILTTSFSTDNVQKAYDVQSSLSKIRPTHPQEATQLASKLSETNQRMLATHIDAVVSIDTETIKIRVEAITQSSELAFNPSSSIGVNIPPNTSQCAGVAKAAAIAYDSNIYQYLTGDQQRLAAPMVSLSSYCDGVEEVIQGLATPISLEFLIDPLNAAAQAVLKKREQGDWSE